MRHTTAASLRSSNTPATAHSHCSISKLPQLVFRSIEINTTKYRPLVIGSIDPNTTVAFCTSIDPNTTVVFCSIYPNTSVVFRSIGLIPNVVLRSNQEGSNVAFCSINVVIRSI